MQHSIRVNGTVYILDVQHLEAKTCRRGEAMVLLPFVVGRRCTVMAGSGMAC